MRRALLALLAACLALPPAAGAASASPAEIVAKLNSFRAEHGLPGGITLNPDWSESCRRHDEYMAANDTLTHDQVPGRPGYSAAGAWAGQNAVLSQGSTWTRGTVFLNAPIHLAQILSPRLRSMGAFETSKFVCMTSWPGYGEALAAPTDTLYSLPGDGRRFPHLQQAAERPWTPQTKVGIPEGATTGPYLYVWWEGPTWEEEYDQETGELVRAAQRPLEVISAASLTGPGGPVEIEVINRDDVSGYIAKSSGWLLPVKPLQPGATYTASVTFSTEPGDEPARSWTGSFSFTATSGRLTSYIPVPGVESVSVGSKVRRATVYRKGVSARVQLDGAGFVAAGLFAGRRLVGQAGRTLRAAGSLSLRVKAFRGSIRRGTRNLTLRLAVAGARDERPFEIKRRIALRR